VEDLQARLQESLADRYHLGRELGRGGMAVVYLADDLKHSRQVAIKVLKPELVPALGTERFLREIQIAARLAHPNILPLYDSGEADGLLYYVMPYVEGETLRDRLTREEQLPLRDAVGIARRLPTLWPMPTRWVSSTGMSSRRTSFSRPATPWSATSGSHAPSRRRVANT
jgi:predicted Ser/Thr protein kinase